MMVCRQIRVGDTLLYNLYFSPDLQQLSSSLCYQSINLHGSSSRLENLANTMMDLDSVSVTSDPRINQNPALQLLKKKTLLFSNNIPLQIQQQFLSILHSLHLLSNPTSKHCSDDNPQFC
ncbi:hypothetical protein Peur_018696 [Populus x canadensis]